MTALAAAPAQPTTAHAEAAHYLWAVLIARIYEIFPLLCPLCGGQMRIIAFITHSADIRQILNHIGADSEPPHISPARGPQTRHRVAVLAQTRKAQGILILKSHAILGLMRLNFLSVP